MKHLICCAMLALVCSSNALAQCPDRPDAGVEFANNDICEGDIVGVTNITSENGNSLFYVWNWGDGSRPDTVYDKSTPYHVYLPKCTSNGTHQFDFRLDAVNTDKNCLSHYVQKPIYVYNRPQPKFSVNDPICIPDSVANFMNQSCPSKLKYAWNFGDPASGMANTDTLVNPRHFYKNGPGTYTITLVATSKTCGSATFTKSLQVLEGPKAIFSMSPTSGCAPGQEIQLTNNSLSYTSSLWTVSPNMGWYFKIPFNTFTTNPVMVFDKAGTYRITLKVSGCGSDDTTLTLVIRELPVVKLSNKTVCDTPAILFPDSLAAFSGGAIDSYRWTFANGSPDTSTLRKPGPVRFNTPGSHQIVLAATNECGTTYDTAFLNIIENPQARYSDSLSNTNGCAPLVVKMTDQSVSVQTYRWKVSPATGWTLLSGSLTGRNPVFSFNRADTFTVTLEGSNPFCTGKLSSETKRYIVKPGVILRLDTIPNQCSDFVFDPGQSAGISNADSITWKFTGGIPDTATGANPGPVVFAGLGNYAIRLSAANACGNRIIERRFSILTKPVAKVIDTISGPALCAPAFAGFTDSSALVSVRQWSVTPSGKGWTFVSGSSGTVTAAMRFWEKGNYVIRLNISNECGSDVWSRTFTLLEAPSVTLDSVKPECDLVRFNADSLVAYAGDIAAYNWSFPGGSPSNAADSLPGVVTFNLPGVFRVGVKVSGFCGTDSAATTVTVWKKAAISLDTVPDYICNTDTFFRLVATPRGGTWSGSPVNAGGVFNPAKTPTGPYAVTYSIGSGSCLATKTKTFRVSGNAVEAGADRSLCSSEGPIVLSGMPINGVWRGKGIRDSLAGMFDPTISGVGTFRLDYRYTDPQSGCVNADSLRVTVKQSPVAIMDSIGLVCQNQPHPFVSRSQYAVTTSWDFGDGTGSSLPNPSKTYASPGNFTITLLAISKDGCRDSTRATITVLEPPFIGFAPSVREGCAPLTVSFLNNSGGPQATYAWDLGNGATSVAIDPGVVIYPQGVMDTLYRIRLTVKNGCATLTKTDSVLVHPKPRARFGTNVGEGCTPLKISIANACTGSPKSWFWDFGNGITSRDSLPPDQVYKTDTVVRTYRIRLITTNTCGADTLEKTIVVRPVKSRAFFNMDAKSGCEPLTVKFTNFSTFGTSVYYDFGDGGSSSRPDTAHTFRQAGTYKVVCYATDGCGYDSTIQYVTVHPLPKVQFSHAPTACAGAEVTFSNNSVDVISTKWLFGDGDSSNLFQPMHRFAAAGQYRVQLSAANLNTGCKNVYSSLITITPLPAITLAVPDNDGCVPFTAQFSAASSSGRYFAWDFGDGNTSVAQAPANTYVSPGTYLVRLRVTDNAGCFQDTVYNKILVYPAPVSRFSFQAADLCGVPARVSFLNASTGADGYLWTFGNGNTSTANNPVATYTAPGSFKVLLRASNQYGCTDTFSRSFRVYEHPAADFDILPQVVCLGDPVVFANQSAAGDGYVWHFGDGDTSSAVSPSHVYREAGVFNVTLVANKDRVCYDTLTLYAAVRVKLRPVGAFVWRDSLFYGAPGGVIVFTDQSQYAAKWLWDFGDGDTAHVRHPLHRYVSNQVRTVRLVVTGADGCRDTVEQEVGPRYFKGLFVPNAFSPDNGVGDVRVFKPAGSGLKHYVIEVFSTFGQRVWYSDKLENGQPAESWDGTLNGKPLPQDVYVWKVQAIFENGEVWQGNKGVPNLSPGNTGTVTLLR